MVTIIIGLQIGDISMKKYIKIILTVMLFTIMAVSFAMATPYKAIIIGILLVKVLPIFNKVYNQLGSAMEGIAGGLLKLGQLLGSIILAFEVMNINSAIRNMIRDSKNYQIDSVIQTSASEGMLSKNQSLINLHQNDKITREITIEFATYSEQIAREVKVVNGF